MFVKSMFKAEWWDWFLITLSNYEKYSVIQNSLVLKMSDIVIDAFSKWVSDKHYF